MRNNPNGITIHSLLEREAEQKAARKLQAKHKVHERILKPFKADSKTVFYCETKDKAERTINEYKKRQINYKKI